MTANKTDPKSPSPARGRPRSSEARKAIHQAFLTEILAQGYARVSIDAVAKKAGVSRNTILKFIESRSRREKREELSLLYDELNSCKTADLERMIEEEWKSYLTGLTLEKIRGIFSGKAVEAFELTLEEVDPQEICERLQIGRDSLYVLRSRVRQRYLEELRRLIKELEF